MAEYLQNDYMCACLCFYLFAYVCVCVSGGPEKDVQARVCFVLLRLTCIEAGHSCWEVCVCVSSLGGTLEQQDHLSENVRHMKSYPPVQLSNSAAVSGTNVKCF